MANTIAHLAVAKVIADKNPEMIQNERAYYLGTLAPDTVTSRPGAGKEEKKRVHLRGGIRDAEWLFPEQMAVFAERINQFILHQLKEEKNPDQRDFNMGYLVHLLTDCCNHETIRQKLLQKAAERGIVSSDKEFFHMCVNDLGALDAYLLASRPELGELFAALLSRKSEFLLQGWIEQEDIDGSMQWWQEKYLPETKERRLLYITTADMEEFLEYSAEKVSREIRNLLQ